MNSVPGELVEQYYPCIHVSGLRASASPALVPPAQVFPGLCAALRVAFAAPGRRSMWDPQVQLSKGISPAFHAVLVDPPAPPPPAPQHSGSTAPRPPLAGPPVRLPPRKVRVGLATRPASAASVPALAPKTATAVHHAAEAALARLPARSSLSPLHPSSPLFPDGIISPLWIRRHREQVPAVYVAFVALAQPHGRFRFPDSLSPNPAGPKPLVVDGETEESMLLSLKHADEKVIAFLARARTSLAERGIRLCTVLVTSQDMMRDPMIEARVAYIRRNANLDQKASVYLLTPEPLPPRPAGQPEEAFEQAQIQAQVDAAHTFVAKLEAAQFEYALDYYREHVRRTRRKRARYPPTPSAWAPVAAAVQWQYVYANGIEPVVVETSPSDSSDAASETVVALPAGVPEPCTLSREGWHVRLEFKLGMFSEMAGDWEAALQHYTEAYDTLASSACMGSTVDFPPRTKRWAEAKMLADTLNMRVIRLLLYQYTVQAVHAAVARTMPNAGPLAIAMTRFHRHLQRFSELSAGWGIGDTTFEYWSWRAKQERLLADLLAAATDKEQGNPTPLVPPSHAPPLPSNLLPASMSSSLHAASSLGTLRQPSAPAVAEGSIPLFTLPPHAGYFYYSAALCVAERVRRYYRYVKEQGDKEDAHPAVAHERTVDHIGLLTEIYALAHKAFEAASDARMALFMRYRLAAVCYENGFFREAQQILIDEGLVDAYEQNTQRAFPVMRLNLYRMVADCAHRSSDAHTEVKYLLRSLAISFDLTSWIRAEALLQAEFKPLVLDDGPEAALIDADAVFSLSSLPALGVVPVQISIRWNTVPASFREACAPLPITVLRIYVSAEGDDGAPLPVREEPVLILEHQDEPLPGQGILMLDAATDQATSHQKAPLALSPGHPLILQLPLRVPRPSHLIVSRVELEVGTSVCLCLSVPRAPSQLEPSPGRQTFYPLPPLAQRPLVPSGTLSDAEQPVWHTSKGVLRLPFRPTHRNYLHVVAPVHKVYAEPPPDTAVYLNERIRLPVVVHNDEAEAMNVWCTLEALHPRSAVLGANDPDEVELTSTSQAVLRMVDVQPALWFIGTLAAGSRCELHVKLRMTSLPGVPRKLSIQVISEPPASEPSGAKSARTLPSPAAGTKPAVTELAVEQPFALTAKVDRQHPEAQGAQVFVGCDVRLDLQFQQAAELVLTRIEAVPWPKAGNVRETRIIGGELVLDTLWRGGDEAELVISTLVEQGGEHEPSMQGRMLRVIIGWKRTDETETHTRTHTKTATMVTGTEPETETETEQTFVLDLGPALATIPPLFAVASCRTAHDACSTRGEVVVYNASSAVGSELVLQARTSPHDDPERTPSIGPPGPSAIALAGPQIQGLHTLLPGARARFDLAAVTSAKHGEWPKTVPVLLTVAAPTWTVGKTSDSKEPVPLPVPTFSATGVDSVFAPALRAAAGL